MFTCIAADDDRLDPALKQNPADAYVISDSSTSRCGLWWENPPPVDGHTPGLIGQFTTDNPEDAKAMLDFACDTLKGKAVI